MCRNEAPRGQLSYKVVTSGGKLNAKTIDKLGLNVQELYYSNQLPGYPAMPLTSSMLEQVKKLPSVVEVSLNVDSTDTFVFPYEGGNGFRYGKECFSYLFKKCADGCKSTKIRALWYDQNILLEWYVSLFGK